MAMIQSPTARSKLDPPEPFIEPEPRFQQPTIWWKSPDEHILEDQHASRVHERLLPHLQYGMKLRLPPPGHVRLLFWWSLDELKTSRPKAQMSADITLDPGGSLDLLKVQQLWGLESVKIIDPLRWKIFETADPNRLSALGVRDLAIERHIFVTENPATHETLFKRTLRLLCIDLYFMSFLGLYHLIVHGGYISSKRAPVPRWYDNTADFRNGVVRHLKEVKRDMDEAYDWVMNCGSRLGIPQFTYSQGTSSLIQWVERFEARRRELTMQWVPVVVLCVLLGLVWLTDTFVVRLF